jgi:hypothetical protein
MTIDMMIMANTPRLVMGRQMKQNNLDDLFSFTAEDGETME